MKVKKRMKMQAIVVLGITGIMLIGLLVLPVVIKQQNVESQSNEVIFIDHFPEGEFVETDNSEPKNFGLTAPQAGTYTVYAYTDSGSGSSYTSATITIHVDAPVKDGPLAKMAELAHAQEPPTTSITSPEVGAYYNEPANFTIDVFPIGADGEITQVQLYRNGIPLNIDADGDGVIVNDCDPNDKDSWENKKFWLDTDLDGLPDNIVSETWCVGNISTYPIGYTLNAPPPLDPCLMDPPNLCGNANNIK